MAERRETTVVVVELESGEFFVITSLSGQRETQVIGVDPTTGALCYSGRPGVDVFPTEAEALQFVTGNSRWIPKSTWYGKAILGYAVLGSVGLLLVAIRLRTSISFLPGGDSVQTVVESKWVKIPLRNPQPLLKGEAKNASDFAGIDIDNVHFFCETRDITRPFPSPSSVQSPDEEFAWNSWLSSPFKAIGLPRHCVVLLQGLADSRTFSTLDGEQLTVALTARRSRLHAGTRYLARGMNGAFSTGNEVECEQLVWPHVTSGLPVPFAMYLWRRGTVPLWWGAEIKSNIAEAEIFVCEKRTYEGSPQYFRRLSRRYASGVKAASKSRQPPLVCINLLRSGVGKPEAVLWQHFHESVKFARSHRKDDDARIFLLDYDWHDKTRAIGEPKTVEGLWQLLKDPTSDIKFDLGEYYAKGQQPKDFTGSLTPNRGAYGGAFRTVKKQDGVIRFNCADSLDRTNAASFFGAVQVLAEQCRQLGYPLDSGKVTAASGSINGRTEAPEASLPPGWEKRTDGVTGRTFYIDHNTRKTTWDHPCPEESSMDKPWIRFDMTVDEFKEATIPSAVAGMAELFLISGDIHATLYTGSKAMHSHIIQIFSEEGGKAKTLSPAQNLAITLQRRFLNVVMDSTRQKQLEMFLGLRLSKYFPSLPDKPLQALTRPNACLLKTVPSMFPNTAPQNALISAKYKDIVWVCPSAAEVVELYIFLSEPCHASQLLLTVGHGADDSTSPSSFDIRAGRHLDSLKLVLEGATVPRCANGTQLLYILPGARSAEDVAITGAGTGGRDSCWLYNFEEQEGELDFLTRVVVLTFYPASPGIPISLGQVEVLGVSLFSGGISKHVEQQRLSAPSSSSMRRESLTPGKVPVDLLSGVHDHVSSQVTGPDVLPAAFDLLSDSFHTPLPVSGSVAQGESIASDLINWDPFDDPSAGSSSPALQHTPGKSTTPNLTSPMSLQSSSPLKLNPAAERYLELLEKTLGSDSRQSINYQEAMELEISRLSLGLSAAERDRALLSVGRDPATLDPNSMLSLNQLAQVRQAASQMALATHIFEEDKEAAAIGLEVQGQSSSEEMDDMIPDCCSHPDCEVVIRKKMSGSTRTTGLAACDSCKRKVCMACRTENGCTLLVNLGGIAAGSSGATFSTGPARGPPAEDAVLCQACCPQTYRDGVLLDRVRILASVRRKTRVKNSLSKALAEVAGLTIGPGNSSFSVSSTRQNTSTDDLQLPYKGLTSLAEYPYASLLSSVPAAEGSEPAQSLIAHPKAGSSYWKLPFGITSADISIVLNAQSLVSAVCLIVSPCGYSPQETPQIDVWCSNTVAETERLSLGRWDIGAIGAGVGSASESIYGPESVTSATSAAPRHVLLNLPKPVRCRILWVRISLQNVSTASQDLLGSPPRGAMGPICIHAKRLLVLGKLAEDTEYMPQGQDRMIARNALDTSARTARLKVQVESERIAGGGRKVQQFIAPNAPPIAGFRLDAIAAVKSAARYTISASNKIRVLDQALGSAIDEAVTNPVSLQISVSAVQGDSQAPVPVGVYSLPITRPGTPLYYDFGQVIAVRYLQFDLLGDISTFAEETDQTESSDRDSLLPASLSLANKIRPYRQVLAVELGKWPQVNAI